MFETRLQVHKSYIVERQIYDWIQRSSVRMCFHRIETKRLPQQMMCLKALPGIGSCYGLVNPRQDSPLPWGGGYAYCKLCPTIGVYIMWTSNVTSRRSKRNTILDQKRKCFDFPSIYFWHKVGHYPLGHIPRKYYPLRNREREDKLGAASLLFWGDFPVRQMIAFGYMYFFIDLYWQCQYSERSEQAEFWDDKLLSNSSVYFHAS